MTPEMVISLAKETVELTLLISLPMLAVGLIIGVGIGLLQSLTQIQEMTLVLVPKIIATLLVLLFMLPWMMNKMTAYTEQLILNIPLYAK
ncbi:MAG TPA: flagellar biosynthesis protein FliQ [Thermodesulfobacteriota bacterium]|jgi:flagellar biosynthesis protein FliQ|nr:flagellar biosynthesis protein FliQ [Thermodesulfobacteriota bacterium]